MRNGGHARVRARTPRAEPRDARDKASQSHHGRARVPPKPRGATQKREMVVSGSRRSCAPVALPVTTMADAIVAPPPAPLSLSSASWSEEEGVRLTPLSVRRKNRHRHNMNSPEARAVAEDREARAATPGAKTAVHPLFCAGTPWSQWSTPVPWATLGTSPVTWAAAIEREACAKAVAQIVAATVAHYTAF
jgi:hypothetical protein